MHFPSQSSFVFLFFITLTKFSFACENWPDHATDVIKLLNVSLTSEATNDPGKTPSTNGLAYITVNGKSYAPQTKGFNVAVFDHLSGRFLTSAAFDCAASPAKCNELGTFLSGLPQDTVVLIAIQESGLVSGRSLPTNHLEEVGIQSSSTLRPNYSFTSIGYKGKNAVDWKKELQNNDGAGPTTIAALIPINCSYMPSASTTCSPFNVASQKYGGSCMNSSNGDCRYATDDNSTTRWESSSSGVINSYLKIEFHTSFTVNKLRIQQSVTTGQRIQEILLEFSDCSHEKFTLKANSSDFEELRFLSRPAKWIKFTVKKLYGASGGVGIQEIEVYNEYCNQKSLCDAVHLNSNNQSSHYRLHNRKFQFMIDAQKKVTVLLTSGSLVTSSRYEIIIESAEDNQLKLKRIKGNLAADLLVKNVTGPLKENEMRSFWIEVETDRVVFGSGEVLYLFWRDSDPINVKYVFFSTTTSTAIIHVCGRTDQCYKDATHYWPLDKPVFVKDINNGKIGKIHGPWITERAAAKADFSPLALSIDSSASWVDLGDLSDSCLSIPSKCPNGFSLSFKASISGTGTGYLLSLGTVSIFYVDETMYFTIKDTHKEWGVKGAFKRNTWQTFSIGWSYANGLTAVIVGNAATVLYDFSGKTVTPSVVTNGSFTIGRPKYFSGSIRDVAIWELEISEERMKTLHVCNDPDSCPVGWEYFDGSCYKVSPSNLSASAAREACVSETTDLVKITSEEENAFVRSLLIGDAWIGLEREPNDGLYYWRDGMKVSYEKWNNGSSSGDCVVMESSGNWCKTSCSSYTSRYVCEQVPYQYLGCYKDGDTSPAFVFNPGGYEPSSMTPGLCMHECGTWYYNYAAVKGGMLCLCSNTTSPAAESASDMCFWPCFGSGNLKCGGEGHISVFKSVTVWPRRLNMSLDSFVYTFKAFNITLTQTLPANETVESYTINIGDGTTHYTTHSPATIAILHPGSYYIKGTAIVKHSKTGYRSTIESPVKTVRVVSNLTGLDISCQSCAPVNVSAGCSVMFRYGSNVDYAVQFGDGKGQVNGSLPDAAILTVGTPAGEAHSPITSDGLYLMAGTEVKSKGEAVALEMDVETGGSLEIMVYRPTCTDSTQRYCPSTKTCISDITMCTDSENKTCDNDAVFSFSDGQCVVQSMSRCKNETLPYGDFDYQQIHKYLLYTTSGPKRILIEDVNQRFQLQPGDVFGVRFAPSGPTGALKTSSSGSSLFYSSAVINKTGAGILRGNYHPFTEHSPQNRSILPAIALVVSTISESRVERVYEEVGHKTIALSVGNSVTRENVEKSICLQEMVKELRLNIPEVFPSAESVNLTGSITKGTNATFIWDFGDNSNDTTKLPWVTKIFDNTGERTLGVLAGNKIGVAALWCQVVIQERIAGLKFKNDSLKAIENGTTASIGWTLFNGSHVEFNVTITLPDGSMETRNLTDVKVPGARFFGLYKSNFTIVGWYSVVITATNRVNNETIAGNLSVQYAIHGVVVEHPPILKTNETFNFTVLPHLGDEMARYTLHTMDGKTTNSTDKVIPYTYTAAGRYKVVLIASNDVSSMLVNCTEIIVQDVIEGLKYTSVNHSVAVNAPAEVHWRLTQGSELLFSIDYGDGSQKIVNRSLSVGDIFVAISTHNYTEPGEYVVVINASNLVDSKTINTTVYVETPAEGPGLAIWRTTFPKAQEKLCNKELYIAANNSVTLNVTISNGTNLNVAINFGDNSSDESLYFPREFPTSGWSTNHSYSIAGKYNITVTFFNRNPSNVSYTCLLIVQYRVEGVMVTSDSPKNSSDAAVTLNVSFPGPEFKPSGPLNYYWRYGDNNYSLTNNSMTVYNYPNKCGVYIVTVNVSNEISSGIGSVEVIIQDAIQGLEIITKHTEYENQSCSDFTLRNGTYPVEYDVSFKAFITNGTNVTFTWNLDNNGGKNYTNETFLHKFSPRTDCTDCKHTIRLKAQNKVSNLTRDVTITLMESIHGVNLTDDGPTVQGKAVNFTLSVGQKGHDPRFLLELDIDGAKYPKQYKKNEWVKLDDLYCTDNNRLNCTQYFDVMYGTARGYTVDFRANNSVSCIKLKTITVLVGRGPCEIPKISVPGFESGETKTFTLSEKITIETDNEINCFNDTTEFRWKITKRCGSDEEDPMPEERTTPLAKLDFGAGYFNICAKIEFQFSINMTWAEGFYNEKKVSIKIIPTPLVASILGGSKRTVGSDVIVQIDASKSVDPDEPGSNFEFAWFCNFSGGKLPKSISPTETKNPLSNGSCFGYAPGQLTDFNETKIIKLNTSMAIPNSTYTIRFIMAKGGRQSFKDQDITLVPGDPPDMSIECVKNCKEKLNPSEKFSLKGKGKSKGNREINYQWSVQMCNTSSDTCLDDWNLESYLAVPNLRSETLVIKPDYFKDDMKYAVTLSGNVHGGATGKSTYDVVVNKPPANGECSVSPKEGEPLKTLFTITCKDFKDTEVPLTYTFFYKKAVGGPLSTLDQSFSPVVKDFRLSSGLEANDYKYNFVVKVTDKLGASVDYEIPETVKVMPNKKKPTAKDLTKLLDENLGEIAAGGNLNLKLSFVSSFAQALNEQDTEKQSEEDIEANKEFVDKLVSIALDNTEVKEDMNLADVTQLSGTLNDATSVTKQNSPNVINKVSSFIKSAGNAILNQAKTVSSKDIQGTSESVVGTAINVILTDSSNKDSDGNNTQSAVGTIKTVGRAMLTTLIAGEKEITMEKKSLALGVERYNAKDMGNKTVALGGSEVILPANFTTCGNQNSSVNRMILVSNENLYSGGEGGGQVTDKVVSLSFTGSKDDGSDDVDGAECKVKGLEEEISVMLPRNNTAKDSPVQEGSLRSDKYSIHEFNLTENASAVTVQVAWNISVAVQIYIKKGSRPKPEEGVYDFNATFRLGGRYSDHSTNLSRCELFLSNDDLNWTAAGQYFVMMRYTKNDSLPVEELKKIGSDDTVPYNFSMYTSKCMFYDEKKNVWSTDGLKVGPKTNLMSTECLTTHLTTFGSSFFVPPNKINFDKLSVQQLLDSPHALIFVCVILGLYLICLIPAKRADKRDALQTGVTPLPDNDSRDTYCYEIHVHTGFIRGAGTSAEVSIVLTGGLEETEPRVLKDPNRKNFKTGSVDPFLLTVPQSLGSLKHIRIWHNNGGNYPSWNLLRVMIQDLQTDQRWWFVCDDWFAVDEGDGKIERILYPASKKDLTKFNVLFTSEVRKNLTDGHIWFSVVARPPRSNFSRVQRLTCCLSILMTTLIANAMFYEVGENETPKNAIRIMGFSFSIRQVSIGIMSSMIVFPANLIIVTIFRKAKPKASQYEVKLGHSEGEDVDIEAGEEKKKSPKKFALPHWFVYVAYVIAFFATCTSASFVILYGMEFGSEKSAQWLSSITISFIQDVLFTQPIKVFIMATLFALLIKDPKKAEQESFADANTLANDEEWLQKNTEDLDPETQQTLKQLINDKPPDEAKLEIARKLRMKERQMESIIREIAWYVIFLLVLLTIAYGNRDLTTSKVTKYMKDTFEDSVHGENVTYGKVHEISHYWTWIRTIFIPSLMPRYYYNNIADYDRRFLADTPTAFLLGVVRLRQLRIKKDTCVFKRYFLYFIHECNDFYSIDEEDRGSYLPGWKVKPMTSNQSLLANSQPDPWMYQTGSQLNTYPYWGYKATYSAGGFVQELPNNESEALNAIQNLSDTNWLDRYTRAIFSEFAIYNANTNLFSVVTLLFEQLPTGSLTPYPSILTLRLFRYVGGEMYFVLTCEIVYLLFCIYFVFKEIKQLVKKGKEHLKNPWSVLEIFLTCLSLTAVGLYFARLAFTKGALKAMNNNLGTSFVSFHYTAFLDEWLKCIIGIIVFLSFLKVFRLLRFNRRMSMLQQVLKRCFTQLISFMIMFALAFLAFALLACLVFGQIMEGFGTFLDSCASLMDTLLGKFALKEMSQANRIIGPIFFYSYTVSMVFILINMFVTIINDTFTEVRSDVEKQSNDYEIVDFMIHRLKKNIGKTIGHAIHPVYKEPKSDLELKFDKIVDDADNVMHFMRNMTFEDFRKTRWFQNETCTEKKKNLIRLLMEVDWDYYEDELCDSIPVFERFLSERSEEELEAMLQSYRQKRMVEDLVFDKINGEDSSSQSDSDSDDSSDGLDNTSDDEQSSNDENRSETEPNAESDRRPSTSTYSTSSTSSAKVPGTAARVLTPALLITDVRPETVVELEQHVEENRRKSSFADQGVSDNELLAILEDVHRDVESRCATDAELDSILYEDTFTPLRCDSNPETSFTDKKTKKRKKTAELPVEEKTIKEAWVTVSLTAKEPDGAYENTTEGMDGEENAKAKNKMGMETASEVEDKQNKRVKKKGKQDREDHISAVEDGERKPNKTGKKKKKGQDGVDVGAEDNLQGETRGGEGTKRKKKSAASLNVEVIGESDKKETSRSEGAKKEKKKKTIADKAKEEDNGENGSQEQVERESRKESIEISAADEERPKEGERRKKRKKKKEAVEEKGEEKTKGDVDEETEAKKNSNEFSEMFEEVLGSSCEDQTGLKKIKKKGKAKKKLVLEEEDGSNLLKSGETSYGSGEEQKEIKFSLEESSVGMKESADQTGLRKMKKKGKAKKKFVLEEEDGSSLFKSGETSYGTGEEQKERKFSLEESSVERKESVA